MMSRYNWRFKLGRIGDLIIKFRAQEDKFFHPWQRNKIRSNGRIIKSRPQYNKGFIKVSNYLWNKLEKRR